jgi:pimeloyl-ACP methyl ester carboxylesterase
MTLRDEILLMEKKSASPGFIGSLNFYATYLHLNAMFSLAKWMPQSTRTFFGDTNTLKYWNAIADYDPLDTLIKVSAPLYLAHGTADTNCPIESADKLAAKFKQLGKTNLLFKRYECFDHSFNDQSGDNYFKEVLNVGLVWAEQFLRC